MLEDLEDDEMGETGGHLWVDVRAIKPEDFQKMGQLLCNLARARGYETYPEWLGDFLVWRKK